MFSGKIDLTKLDHKSIKESFLDYLADQEEFKDINFDGSNFNALLSFLSYHTYFNAYYDNMIFNESFLDSAQKRSSVVSRAKEINYIPHGRRASRAVVSISVPVTSFNETDKEFIKIPRYTTWTGYTADKQKHLFNNMVEVLLYKTLNPETGQFEYKSEDVELVNGKRMFYEYTYNDAEPSYVIPNYGIDDNLVDVYVKQSKTSGDYKKFTRAINSVNGVGENVFYLQVNNDLQYEIFFGDGIFGVSPTNGNHIRVEYMMTEGKSANDCVKFEINGTVVGLSQTPIINTIVKSFGGTDDESIESIRRNAPLRYQSQGRAVTTSDYYPVIKDIFPNIKSVSVWGGEENNPPLYGRVLIAVLPDGFPFLSAAERKFISDELVKKYSVIGIKPVIMNPDYNEVILAINIDISTAVVPSVEEFINRIKSKVTDYINNVNADFNVVISDSQIATVIHNISSGIKHVDIDKSIKKKMIPQIGVFEDYEFWFDNLITPGTVTSSWFFVPDYTVSVRVFDNGDGKLFLIDKKGNTTVEEIGTVDYQNGYVHLKSLNIRDIAEKNPGIIMKPVANYMNFLKNNVAVSLESNIIIQYREV
jgi:hypothetical protein